MSPRSSPLRLEDLLGEQAWLERLARSLVGPGEGSDDLVQSTWLAALKRPPSTDRPLRPWLAGVMRNLWRAGRRGEARRRQRETEVAGGRGSEPAPDESLADFELRARVARLVLELPEPYRTVVVQRYHVGRTPAEIARRRGAPASTVRAQLSRGLDQLRAQLDDEQPGGRNAWVALLAPLARRAELLGAAVGPSPLLVAALVLVLVAIPVAGLFAWRWVHPGGSGTPPVAALDPVSPTREARTAGAPSVPSPASAADASGRRLLGQASSADVRAERITGRAVDHDGRPLARVELRALWYDDTEIPVAYSDADGRFSYPRRLGDGPYAVYSLLLRHPRCVDCKLPVQDDPREGPVDLGDVVLDPGGSIRGRVVDVDGIPLARVRVHPKPPGGCAEGSFRLDSSDLPGQETDAEGRFAFEGMPTGTWELCTQAARYATEGSGPLELREGDDLRGVEIVLDPLPPDRYLSLQVLGPDGRPLADQRIELCLAHRSGVSSFQGLLLDAHGRASVRWRHEGATCLLVVPPLDSPADEQLWSGELPLGDDLVLRLPLARTFQLDVIGVDGRQGEKVGVDLELADPRVPCDNSSGSVARERRVGSAYRTRRSPLVFKVPSGSFFANVSPGSGEAQRLGPFEPDAVAERLVCHLQARTETPPAPTAFVRLPLDTGGKDVDGVTVFTLRRAGEPVENRRSTTHELERPNRMIEQEVEPGLELVLAVEAEGFARSEVDVPALAEGEHRELATVRLHVGGTIEGRVLGDDLQGIEQVRVGAECANGQRFLADISGDGRYRFEHLPLGRCSVGLRLQPKAADWFPPDPLAGVEHLLDPATAVACEVSDETTTRIDLPLPAVALLSGVLRIDGTAPVGWEISDRGPGSITMGSFEPRNSLNFPIDGDGRFGIRTREAGAHRIWLSGPLGSRGKDLSIGLELEARPGETARKNLSLRTGRIEGRLATPLEPGEVLDCRGSSDGVSYRATPIVLDDEHFAVEAWPEGEAEVWRILSQGSDPADWKRASARLQVRAGETATVELR